MDDGLAKVIQKEFPGQWAFSSSTTRSAGVGIALAKMSDEHEHISDNGRLLGKLVMVNNQPLYLISIYAPCSFERHRISWSVSAL